MIPNNKLKTNTLIILLSTIFSVSNLIELKGQYSGAYGIESLSGLEGVAYEISEIDSNFIKQSFLTADTAIKLKRAGIKILTQKAMIENDRQPLLFIQITFLPLHEIDIFFFTIEVDLNQRVVLAGDESLQIGATTWSTSILGNSTSLELQKNVQDALAELLDIFIEEYSLMN